MRITNALVTRSIVARLQSSQARLQEAQQRVTSGLRVERMSDDPTAGSAIMQAGAGLRGLAQYRRNVETAGSQLNAEDVALDQLGQVLARAKELGVGQAGANASTAGRKATAGELRQLYDQAVALANQKLGDVSLFGGTTVAGGAPPFEKFDAVAVRNAGVDPFAAAIDPAARDGLGQPIVATGTRQVEIAAGQTMATTHAGQQVFVDSGALQGLYQMAVALENDDPDGITAALGTVDRAFDATQARVGEIGARQNQVDAVAVGIDALDAALVDQRSHLSEVDAEQAITEMMTRQTAYQAAMLASSKVMGLSLVDYLR